MSERFLVDDQSRTTKKLQPLDISPTIRKEMHGNEPRVVEPNGWRESERGMSMTSVNEINENDEQTPFNYVSLFSGIGGFEQALNELGGQCVLASEIDKFAKKSYEALYGEEPIGDIMEVNAEDVPEHDLLVGGFPCQAFSVAGHRGGFEDARGTLFFEMARIADEKQPKAIIAENVKGLVGHDKGKTLDTIVKTLNDIGYRVDFNVMNSKFFGVPQNRERIFIMAVREDLVDNEPWTIEGSNVVAKGKRRISGYEDVKTFNFDWPAQDEVTTRLRDVLEPEVDEKYYLSDEKTAQLVSQLDESEKEKGDVAIKEAVSKGYTVAQEGDAVNFRFPESETRRGRVGHQCAKTLEATGINQGVIENGNPIVNKVAGLFVMNRQAGSVYDKDGLSPTLDTSGGGHREPKIHEKELQAKAPDERMSRQAVETYNESDQPKEHGDMIQAYNKHHLKDGICPTLTTRPDGFKTASLPIVQQGVLMNRNEINDETEVSHCLMARDWKGYGNQDMTGVVEKEVRPTLTPDRDEKRQNGRRFKENDEEMFTLTSQDQHGVTLQDDTPAYRIRKLTPLECFRLQGFPDESHDAVRDAGISDSQLYKQTGNAVTVSVVKALSERLLPLINENDEH